VIRLVGVVLSISGLHFTYLVSGYCLKICYAAHIVNGIEGHVCAV
jgi:hypothetical protein